MEKQIIKSIVLIALIFFFLSPGQQVKGETLETDVTSITTEPDEFENEYVKIKGIVSNYQKKETTTTNRFIIIGEYGAPMIVQTQKALPKIDSQHFFEGTVNFDSQGRPFLTEMKRNAYINPLYYVLGGAIIVLLVLILITVLKSNGKKTQKTDDTTTGNISKPNPEEPAEPEEPVKPKSLTLFPGKFEVLSGPESGRVIKSPAFPKGNYSIVTIGSKMVSPPEDVSHILLRDRSIDSLHVEFRLYENKSVKVKNLSSETYFTSVGDEELMPNVVSEILPGTVITLGETKIKYVR